MIDQPIRMLCVLTVLSSCLGCANFDLFKFGKPKSAAAQFERQVQAKKKRDDRQRNGWLAKVKRALPQQSPQRSDKIQHPSSELDPTSLAHQPQVRPSLYVAAARLAERSGDAQQAIEKFGLALELEPQNRDALLGLARLHQKLGKTDQALQVYTRAQSHHRNDPVVMNDLGLCYARAGRLPEAISMLTAATRAAPNRQMYRNNLAATLVEAGRQQEALAHLNQTLDQAQSHYTIGYLLQQQGNADAARPYLQQALQANPHLVSARQLLARLDLPAAGARTAAPPTTSAGVASGAVRQQAGGGVSRSPLTRPGERQAPTHRVAAQPAASRPVTRSPAKQPPAASTYQIPVGTARPRLKRPAPSRPQGQLPSSAPAGHPGYLQRDTPRSGPFGYVPLQGDGESLQLVSFVEQAESESAVDITSEVQP